MGSRSRVGRCPFRGLGMTRIGPAEATRDSEGSVDVELHGLHLIFTRHEWELFLYGPDSHRLRYNSLSWAVCLVPPAGALADWG